ncbi:MAG: hypothetical protein GXO90_02245 [FCB group bacterium]|nr:hypothetical protein [FCB group bacterium]
MKNVLKILGFLLFAGSILPAKTWSVDSIRIQLEEQTRQIHDYTVTVTISVSMPKFRMPKKKIKVYYRRAGTEGKPDQIKLKTNGFAVVPKTGLNFNVFDLLDNFLSIDPPEEVQMDEGLRIRFSGAINPDSLRFKSWDSDEEMPSLTQSLWIDPERWVVTRSEIRLDTTRVLTMISDYGVYSDHLYLPERTEVNFTLGSQLLQRLDRNRGGPGPMIHDTDPEFTSKNISGQVVMKFTRYRINKGIPDRIFQEDEPE